MKFATLIALAGVTSAVKVSHKQSIKASTLLKLEREFAELPDDIEITPEMYVAHAEEQGWPEPSEEEMAELEELFHAIDTDGSGSHSKAELEAAWGVYREHCPAGRGRGPRGGAKIQTRSLLKMKLYAKNGQPDPSEFCPSPEEQEVIAGEFRKLPADVAITRDDYIAAAAPEGITLDQNELEIANEIFEAIDTNGDGAHSKRELRQAYDHFMGEYCS